MKDWGFLVDLARRQRLPSNQPRRPAGFSCSLVRSFVWPSCLVRSFIANVNPVFPRENYLILEGCAYSAQPSPDEPKKPPGAKTTMRLYAHLVCLLACRPASWPSCDFTAPVRIKQCPKPRRCKHQYGHRERGVRPQQSALILRRLIVPPTSRVCRPISEIVCSVCRQTFGMAIWGDGRRDVDAPGSTSRLQSRYAL